jgi:phosphoribosyl 1,2-cyclic phosphate phosphodiesterase
MSDYLEFTILGSGASGGVPKSDGDWGRCDPLEPRNRRTRCSLAAIRKSPELNEINTTLVVDLSPEFRLQSVAAGIKRIDAVLFSHDHADQTHGIDDIRAFAYRQRGRIPCWADPDTTISLMERFSYIFKGVKDYPAIADFLPCPPYGVAFEISGPSGAIPVLGYEMDHGQVRATGYRFGDVAYSSDVVGLPDASKALLQNLDVFIVDALRYAPHPSHAHLDLALQWIEELKPQRAIVTNLHIDMDYQTLKRALPHGVEPAYDGLTIQSPL